MYNPDMQWVRGRWILIISHTRQILPFLRHNRVLQIFIYVLTLIMFLWFQNVKTKTVWRTTVPKMWMFYKVKFCSLQNALWVLFALRCFLPFTNKVSSVGTHAEVWNILSSTAADNEYNFLLLAILLKTFFVLSFGAVFQKKIHADHKLQRIPLHIDNKFQSWKYLLDYISKWKCPIYDNLERWKMYKKHFPHHSHRGETSE